MRKLLKVIGYGTLVWGVPLVLSFVLFNHDGDLLVSYELFKSLMIVVSTNP